MDELIRDRIHDALAVEPPPAGLRARVIAAVPMDRPVARAPRLPFRFSGQWASGFAAVLLTAALLAALVYSRGFAGLNHQVKPGPASTVRLSQPEGIAVAPDGTIYVADYLSNRVFRLQPDGALVTVAGGGSQYEGPATKSNIFGPIGLAVASNGDLFIADNPGAAIRRVDRNGNLTTYFTWHSAGPVMNPAGLAIDPSGLLYASFGGQVAALKPDGSTSPIDLSGVPAPGVWPGLLAFDSAGDLYVADVAPVAGSAGQQPPPLGGCRILRISPDHSVSVIAGTGRCGFSGDGGPAVDAQLDDPKGIAFDAAGNLYFADSHNHRVRRIDTRGVISTVAGTGVEGDTGDGGPAIQAELAYLGGVAMAQGRFLYFAETETASGAYGAVRVIDLRTGTINTVVSTRSKVVR